MKEAVWLGYIHCREDGEGVKIRVRPLWMVPDAEVLVVGLPEGDVVEVVSREGGEDGEDGRDHLGELVAELVGPHEQPPGRLDALRRCLSLSARSR